MAVTDIQNHLKTTPSSLCLLFALGFFSSKCFVSPSQPFLLSTMGVIHLLFIMCFYSIIVNSSPDESMPVEILDPGNDISNQVSPLDSGMPVGPDNSITTENPVDQSIPSHPTDPSNLEKFLTQINPTDQDSSLDSVQITSSGKPDSHCAPSDPRSSRKMRRGGVCKFGGYAYEHSPSSREDFICRLPEYTLCCKGPLRELVYTMGCIYCKGFSF